MAKILYLVTRVNIKDTHKKTPLRIIRGGIQTEYGLWRLFTVYGQKID